MVVGIDNNRVISGVRSKCTSLKKTKKNIKRTRDRIDKKKRPLLLAAFINDAVERFHF